MRTSTALEACDKLGDRQLLRIAFEPTEPMDVKFRGKLWVDPAHVQPGRFEGAWAKPPAFVDQMTQLLEFAASENGEMQCRRSVVAGSGGFAIIQKRFRIETDLADFRPRAQKQRVTRRLATPCPCAAAECSARVSQGVLVATLLGKELAALVHARRFEQVTQLFCHVGDEVFLRRRTYSETPNRFNRWLLSG